MRNWAPSNYRSTCARHDLPYSYASRALSLGENPPTFGKLLRHNKVDTTLPRATPIVGEIRSKRRRPASPTYRGGSDRLRNPFDGRPAWSRIGGAAISVECARHEHVRK